MYWFAHTGTEYVAGHTAQLLVSGTPKLDAGGGKLRGQAGGPGGTVAGSQLALFTDEWIVMLCVPVAVAGLLMLKVPTPTAVMVEFAGMPKPVTGMPMARPAVEATPVMTLLPIVVLPVMMALAVPVHCALASVMRSIPMAMSIKPRHRPARIVERRMTVRVTGSGRCPKIGFSEVVRHLKDSTSRVGLPPVDNISRPPLGRLLPFVVEHDARLGQGVRVRVVAHHGRCGPGVQAEFSHFQGVNGDHVLVRTMTRSRAGSTITRHDEIRSARDRTCGPQRL